MHPSPSRVIAYGFMAGELDSICPGLAPGQMLSGGGPVLCARFW